MNDIEKASKEGVSKIINGTNKKTERVKGKRKKFVLPLVLFLAIASLAAFGYLSFRNQQQKDKVTPASIEYSQTGRCAYDKYIDGLNTYDAGKLTIAKTSYVADEERFTNGNETRLEWVKFVASTVKFTYPTIDQLNINGDVMVDDSGSAIKAMSNMSNNEQFTVTSLDYAKIADIVTSDKDAIQKQYKNKGYSNSDYTYSDEMTDFMLEYIMSKKDLPTSSVAVNIPLDYSIVLDEKTNKQVTSYYVISDEVIDKLLYSSDSFHSLIDIFVKTATGWTGEKVEQYTESEEQDNPEYITWKSTLDTLMEQDGGEHKKKSKWDYVYKRDEGGSYVYENGERVIDYYFLIGEDKEKILAPEMKIMVDVQKERTVEDVYVPEAVIPYTFLGSYYCQFEYKGTSSTIARAGDGTFKKPAGVATPIITKALCSDGLYHDVEVTLVKYYVNQDAIDYALSLSEKNRGLDNASAIRYVMMEVSVKNLESSPITLESDMYLADSNENTSARTGTIAGISGSQTIAGGEKCVFTDWVSSSTIDRRYICWGENFNREFPVVWFNVSTTATDPVVVAEPTKEVVAQESTSVSKS